MPLGVDGRGDRGVIDRSTGSARSVAPILVFGVHEETLVKRADRLHVFPAHQEERAPDVVDRSHRIRIELPLEVFGARRGRSDLVEDRHTGAELIGERAERSCGGVPRAVGGEQLARVGRKTLQPGREPLGGRPCRRHSETSRELGR